MAAMRWRIPFFHASRETAPITGASGGRPSSRRLARPSPAGRNASSRTPFGISTILSAGHPSSAATKRPIAAALTMTRCARALPSLTAQRGSRLG